MEKVKHNFKYNNQLIYLFIQFLFLKIIIVKFSYNKIQILFILYKKQVIWNYYTFLQIILLISFIINKITFI